MNWIKYYAISFGILMTLTGSVVILADEVEEYPPILIDEPEEKSYIYQDEVAVEFIAPEQTIEENIIIEIADPVEQNDVQDKEIMSQDINEVIEDEDFVESPVTESPSGVWGSDATGTYYEVDGNRLKNTVTEIDDAYYGFNSSGYLYQATSFYLSPYYYRAKDDGKLYVNEWYESEYGARYYYGTYGRAADDITYVNSKRYYFEDGYLVTDRSFESSSVSYFSDSDGIVHDMQEGWNTFYESDGYEHTYYVYDGLCFRNTIHADDGGYYFFDSYGNLLKSGQSTFTTGGKTYAVRAWADGTLYRDEWFYEPDYGYRYYYGPGCLSLPGFSNVHGKMYYFDPSGRLYFDTAATIDGKIYIFEEDGSYFQASANGWYQSQSHKYFVSNGKLLTGVLIDGDYMYYFKTDGKMLADDIISDSYEYGTMYYYGANWEGKLVRNNFFRGYYFGENGRSLPNGFQTIDGYEYYFENGRYLKNTIRNIIGTNYIFDITGCMTVAPEGLTTNINTYYVLNGELANGVYSVEGKQRFFQDGIMQQDRIIQFSENEYGAVLADGTLVKNGFYEVKYPLSPLLIQGAVYADSNGKLVNGLKVLDGNTYIFGTSAASPYVMNRNTMVKYGGQWYYADSNGVCTKVNQSTGLINKGDDKFYLSNGELVVNKLVTVGSDTYAIDQYGKVVRNNLWTTRDPAYKIYYANSSGKIVKNTWVTIENQGKKDGEYYFGSDGVAYEGFEDVNGHEYYFVDGRKMSAEIRPINGELYKFSDEGSQYTTGVSNGVYTGGRSLQVVRNGVLVTNELYPYGGQYYLIDGTGNSKWVEGLQIMDYLYEHSTLIHVYNTGNGPVAQLNRHSTTYGLDYFSGADGYIQDGLITYIDGYQYAICNDSALFYEGFLPHAAKNVEVTIKGKKYYADDIGRLLTTKPLPFKDVPEDAWYYNVAKECYETGLISGTSATTFSPMQEMTRAMAVTILWRMEGQPKVAFNDKLSDVSSKQWYSTAVSWALNTGVVHGYGDGTFKPDNPITREQLAIILSNYAKYKGQYTAGTKDLSTYPDGNQVSDYAQAGMKWAVTEGIITGNGAGYLNPKKSATRAEGAAMLLRMKKWIK